MAFLRKRTLNFDPLISPRMEYSSVAWPTRQNPLDEAIAQGLGAAARAATVLAQKKIAAEGVVSAVDESLCRGCGQCVEVCPYGAPELVDIGEGVLLSQIQEVLCKGCGACAVACPTGAAAIRHFTDHEVLTMIEAALCE